VPFVLPVFLSFFDDVRQRVLGGTMFIALFIILLLLWIFGFTAMHVAGFAIHLLLILAIISLIIHFVRPHHQGPPAA
jgi:hypothetical protein